MSRLSTYVGALLLLACSNVTFGQMVPADHIVPESTESPDHRYGVTVPDNQNYGYDEIKNPRNEIIEVKTGQPVGIIQGHVAYSHINDGEIAPTYWSADDSVLFWQVDGKWGFDTEILIKLENGKIKSQIDVLKLIRQEILKRTREAVPEKYAAVKKEGGGDGTWWQDGFAIDSVLDNPSSPMEFPLIFQVFLTSNPKGLEGQTNVDARMTVDVNENGTIKVKEFRLGKEPPAREW